ncbi:zinc ABC transporter substrate-binding protein ZnuA [Zophobihabitans entericus]|uniref:High-affinity zinc uptake system protein ZnuA n=2 Tax=Zophobihabitans entericus TaxID=1635327 RepID=A0A6G9IA26_9GAMM|nr:zinc ABC transporter substrate-binding protein ZnuA [Zophobihabitans entericus]QIQ21085.1 zinc ABC transporter substrate-binding protein ZnuA [Zophobihabitans entericus]
MEKNNFSKYLFLLGKILFIHLTFSAFSINAQAKIISSIKPVGFITEAIAYDVVETDILLPDGASPHSYALRPLDVQKIKSADLVIWIGKDLETFLPNILKNVDDREQLQLFGVKGVEALLYSDEDEHDHEHENEESEHEHEHDHEHGEFDTHIWLSPEIAKAVAVAIHERLLILFPDKKVQLDANLSSFLSQVTETEQVIAKKLISVQNSGYFVFHDAYGYFERQFGLKHLGHFTLNPEIQPGVQKVYQIKQQLLKEQAVCVFREPQFNPAIIDKVISGTHVRSGILDPLGMDIPVSKDAYTHFLNTLTQQWLNCLNDKE